MTNAIMILDALLDKAARLGAENELLKARIAKLEAENAALLRDLKEADTIECEHCKFYKTDDPACSCECQTCKTPCPCNECYHNSLWQWRGITKEDK